MIKFKRSVLLEFFRSSNNQTGTLNEVIEPIRELRVAFDIDKHNGQTPNHATITVYNMSPSDRASIARPTPMAFDWRYPILPDGVGVRLYAGYEDEPIHIFTGEILWAHTNRVGPDWVTEMDCYTGLTESTIPSQVSVSRETEARTVVEQILNPLGITLKYTDAAAAILEGRMISTYSSSGMGYREADMFLRSYGLAFTMEEERQGLVYDPTSPRDENQSKTDGNTFSPTNGLVGTPKITKSGIEIRSLLRPNMAILQKFYVESDTVRGTLQGAPDYSPEYYASHIKHTGDTRGQDWYTDIEGFYTKLETPP